MIQEIALTQLEFTDVFNDTITNVGNIPMPQGTTFDDLTVQMPFTFAWVQNSFGSPRPCMLRICPSSVTIGAINNGTPYDVPCSDFTIYDLFLFKAHPNSRPK
jgi:hypothetical protein